MDRILRCHSKKSEIEKFTTFLDNLLAYYFQVIFFHDIYFTNCNSAIAPERDGCFEWPYHHGYDHDHDHDHEVHGVLCGGQAIISSSKAEKRV